MDTLDIIVTVLQLLNASLAKVLFSSTTVVVQHMRGRTMTTAFTRLFCMCTGVKQPARLLLP